MEPAARQLGDRPSVPAQAGHLAPASRPSLPQLLTGSPASDITSHRAAKVTLLTPNATGRSLHLSLPPQAGWISRTPEQNGELPRNQRGQTATLGRQPGVAFGPPSHLRPFARAALPFPLDWLTGNHPSAFTPLGSLPGTGLGCLGPHPPQPSSSEKAGTLSVLFAVSGAYRRGPAFTQGRKGAGLRGTHRVGGRVWVGSDSRKLSLRQEGECAHAPPLSPQSVTHGSALSTWRPGC